MRMLWWFFELLQFYQKLIGLRYLIPSGMFNFAQSASFAPTYDMFPMGKSKRWNGTNSLFSFARGRRLY